MPDIDIPRERLQDLLGLHHIVGAEWIMDTASVRFHVIGEVPHAESQAEPDRPRKKQQRKSD